MRYRGCSVTDRPSKRAFIVPIGQVDLEAMKRLDAQIRHDRLVGKICNLVAKPEKWMGNRK
jgi:hypothetical protein